ncbi:transcription antitermination protein [Halolamina sp. C58]|uniref:transcription antitermination protein n=1 Tax=Halolamina sp. C58 TaxID=3421640 RepID=UPI003EBCFBCC
MDADTFLQQLRDAHGTELSRLSSSKAVYALTGGEMTGDAVRTGTARELHDLTSVLDEWPETSEDEAADLFADAAVFAATSAGNFDTEAASDAATSITADALAGRESDVERLAGAAAALLVLEELAGQLVGFFVGDADRTSADEFREFRSELAEYRDDAADLLAERCGDDADRTTANEVGADVIDGAYDWYVETLEGMGVEPKNVC